MLQEPSCGKSFIESSIKTARVYGFQGIDLFWLWPNGTNLSGMGVLLKEWRSAIVSEPRDSGVPELVLTMGLCYSAGLEIVGYPIDSMRKNVDWAHVVAYDYHMPSRENFTGNHAGLYPPNYLSNVSTDFGIRERIRRGFPANKLVLGLPYHGYAWTLANPSDNSLGARATGPAEPVPKNVNAEDHLTAAAGETDDDTCPNCFVHPPQTPAFSPQPATQQPCFPTPEPVFSNPQPGYDTPQPIGTPQPSYPGYGNPQPSLSTPQPGYGTPQHMGNSQPGYGTPQPIGNPQPNYPDYSNPQPGFSTPNLVTAPHNTTHWQPSTQLSRLWRPTTRFRHPSTGSTGLSRLPTRFKPTSYRIALPSMGRLWLTRFIH
ncbi:hypothetical protein Tsubulata_025198 [Turnera subulata]|uniref:GH18 domain-containing protein n=1 Tax=Turnera subulata TaxID=218843 RepID=A0A9Q0FJN2_9ROSI|nr:hypothetical protein Tsubulata_025198 [Turnera subulata]